ncbi:very short patch repair endonuclease [Mycolicibacterium obuense]|uniref:very short patch repair endonuclease n=1 Tax=Mycolicibacterium obuense TaxID=1807 RepID=UPI0009E3CB0C
MLYRHHPTVRRRSAHRNGGRLKHPDPQVLTIAPETPRRRADIVFTRARIAVFVDGCFWHSCPKHGTSPKANAEWWREKLEMNVKRDRDTDSRLRAAGWTVIRIWEHEDSADAAAKVIAAVRAVSAM